MRKYNLCCPIRKANPYRRMAKALRTSTIAPNYVKRQFRSYGPRKVLLTDITYLRLKQKHVYLSVIKDDIYNADLSLSIKRISGD